MIGAKAGLGYLLTLGSETYDIKMILNAVILLSVIGLALYLISEFVEKRRFTGKSSIRVWSVKIKRKQARFPCLRRMMLQRGPCFSLAGHHVDGERSLLLALFTGCSPEYFMMVNHME